MKLSRYKTISKGFNHYIDIGDLETYHLPNDKRTKLVRDSRSFVDDKGYWNIYPIADDNREFYIVCPYCGEIHHHGKSPGHRSEHCRYKKPDVKGYIILLPKS